VAEINIVKTTDRTLTEKERMFLYQNLFGGYVDGLGDVDKADWKKLWETIKGLEQGEIIKISFKKVRNGKFHRRFFALLNFAFDAWDPDRQRKSYKGMPVTKNFDRFRKDVTIQAGFYEQTFNLDGEMRLEALSISFASMDDLEFEKVYSAVLDVILQKVLITYKDRDELDAVIEEAMRFM
jgi:hypothetical protein